MRLLSHVKILSRQNILVYLNVCHTTNFSYFFLFLSLPGIEPATFLLLLVDGCVRVVAPISSVGTNRVRLSILLDKVSWNAEPLAQSALT